jgi:hypothetical protein
MKRYSVLFALMFMVATSVRSQDNLIGYFDFDQIRVERKIVEMVRGETYVPKEVFAYVTESVSGEEFDLNGKYYKEVEGVKGKAVLLDGYTAFIEITGADHIPAVEGPFAVEAWIALGAYPKNLCPVLDHQRDVADGYYNGFFFGLDALGRLLLKVATNGRNEELLATQIIPINEWTHIACSYDGDKEITLFLNGKEVGSKTLSAPFKPADPEITSMLIAKSRDAQRPYGTIRPEGTERSHTFFDGIIDELKIYNAPLQAKDIAESYAADMPETDPDLPARVLPSGPKSPGTFRAVNTTLSYYDAWDAPWAIDQDADIVVQFDESDCKFVFWHGTSYIPNWVTENDIWFNNGFNEGWNEHGSCEPMSDKKAKYSSVKIVESNDARVVVQWRYALVDVLGTFAFEDPETGWGDWTNETFTIYPDMVGVREDILLSNAPNAAHEWQESIMVLGPGQRPETILEYEALSLSNIEGESKTYSWEHAVPPHLPDYPENPNIQVVNTKSKYRPFSAVMPQHHPKIDIYSGEIRRDVSVFPWWNHWPVAPRPTDGRYAMDSDRAAHASLSHWLWEEYEKTDRSMTKLMLNGVTTKSVEELVPLTKSWSYPAELSIENGVKAGVKYNAAQKAYEIVPGGQVDQIRFTLRADRESPIINPAFVIEGWGRKDALLTVNGKEIPRGKEFRYGFRDRLDAVDLVSWVRFESEKETTFTISKSK